MTEQLKKSTFKDRDLSPFDYLKALQLEYICAELRKKIYHSPKDKEFYKGLMLNKKIKIEDISFKNRLSNIFNDIEVKKELYLEIYNSKGLPNFIYRNKEHESIFKEQDICNYYLLGEEVKVETDTIIFGKIFSVNISQSMVEITDKEDNYIGIFEMTNATRIL